MGTGLKDSKGGESLYNLRALSWLAFPVFEPIEVSTNQLATWRQCTGTAVVSANHLSFGGPHCFLAALCFGMLRAKCSSVNQKLQAAGNVEERNKRFKRLGLVRERGMCCRILSTTAVASGGRSN
jgi:hypothetical protein